jgi:hypothetical protein
METFMEKIYTRQVTLVAFDAIKSIINGEIEKTDGYESEATESLSSNTPQEASVTETYGGVPS